MADWQSADLRSIPAVDRAPIPARWEGFAPDPSAYVAGWHGVREHFGLTGFGANAATQDTGGLLVVPHTELEYGGQEELSSWSRAVPGSRATARTSSSAPAGSSPAAPR